MKARFSGTKVISKDVFRTCLQVFKGGTSIEENKRAKTI